MKSTKLKNLLLVAGALFVLSSCTEANAQTNDVPPAPVKRAKARPAKGDELDKVTAQFKKEAQRDHLPGLPDRSVFDLKTDMNDAKNLVTFEARPKDNDFVYHYEYARAKRAWKMTKAWRTDKENHVKEYPVETVAEN
jgi:hypothetical protein